MVSIQSHSTGLYTPYKKPGTMRTQWENVKGKHIAYLFTNTAAECLIVYQISKFSLKERWKLHLHSTITFQLLEDFVPQINYRSSTPRPHWGTSVPYTPPILHSHCVQYDFLAILGPAGESRWICTARSITVTKKTGQTDRRTDGRTDARPLTYAFR